MRLVIAMVLGSVLACGKGAEPSSKQSAEGGSSTTSTVAPQSRLAYAAQLKVTRGDQRPYADVDYVFCLSNAPRRLDYIKATIANQSADWLVAILYSPELRRTKVAAEQTTASRFVSSLRIAAQRGERISNSEITIKPGESRKFVYWYKPDSEMQGDVERTISSPNPPDASVYSKDGVVEWLILPGGDDGADPRYPVPTGIQVGSKPLRITDFHPAPPSACDVTEEGPYAKAPDKKVTSADVPPGNPATTSPKSLGPGKQIDAVLKARCDEKNSGVKTETLSEKTAALADLPAGDLGHFYCGLKGDVGFAKWDDSLVDANLYSISVFGDAIKPGNRWSENHFARLGAEFAKPLLTTAGQKRLDQLVSEYSSKEPEDATRWTIEGIVVDLNQVMAGDQQGKWVMGITPAYGMTGGVAPTPSSAPVTTPSEPTVVVARPSKVTASSAHRASAGYTYVPANLTDGDVSSSWQPATGAPPTWFRLDFADEITVTSIAIANGFQANDKFGDEFLLNSRISKGRATLSDGSSIAIQFAEDARGFVRFDVPRQRTRSVTIFVDDSFRGTKWNDLAVSEIEVRALKP